MSLLSVFVNLSVKNGPQLDWLTNYPGHPNEKKTLSTCPKLPRCNRQPTDVATFNQLVVLNLKCSNMPILWTKKNCHQIIFFHNPITATKNLSSCFRAGFSYKIFHRWVVCHVYSASKRLSGFQTPSVLSLHPFTAVQQKCKE
jgi:hypothetical protein